MDMFGPFKLSLRPAPLGRQDGVDCAVPGALGPARPIGRPGFTIPEFLVAAAILLTLFSMSAGAIAAARGSHRKLTTRDVIAKLEGIVIPHFVSFAGQHVPRPPGMKLEDYPPHRIKTLIERAKFDLPDDWSDVERMVAAGPDSGPQQVYASIWQAIPDKEDLIPDKEAVKEKNGSAECLFMIVMQGGVADCLDCRSLLVDVGDTDGDGMPEFLDGWNRPIGFVFWPSALRLPASSNQNFFSTRLPFDGSAATAAEARARVAKPLIVSAGPDGIPGLNPLDASPQLGAADNITNFDEEARQ